MTFKHIFPRKVLVLGLISMFLVWIPSPGQGDTCQQFYEGDYSPKQGWDTKVSSNTATGDCTLTATKTVSTTIYPNLIIQVKIKASDTTGSVSQDIGYVYPDESTWSEHYEGPVNNSRLTSRTETRPDGSKKITKYDYDSQGHKYVSSVTSSDGKGSEFTATYDSNGRIISAEEKQPNGYVYSTTYGPDGSSTSTTYGPDGKAVAKSAIDGKTGEETRYTCINGICYSTKAAWRGDDSVPCTRCERRGEARGDFAGAKLKLKDEVLGQIEGKPRGDITVVEKGKSALAPVGKAADLATPGIDPTKIKRKAGPRMDALQQQPNVGQTVQGIDPGKRQVGEEVGLNPQPLPPKDISGRVPPKKLSPGDPPPFKEKAKVQDSTAGQKEKLSATPRSQSVGQVFRSGAAKQKIQTQAVQPFKGTTKPQDFRSPAGSSGPVLR